MVMDNVSMQPSIVTHVRHIFHRLMQFPWRSTSRVMYERFREDRLGQTAGSLTFTTTIALVPLVTVILAALTAFPLFSDFQLVVQKRMVEGLVPDNISRQVLGYLTQFSTKANRLGVVGVVVLFFSALALTFTIDRALNTIWRVRQRRPLGQRVLLYWTALTLGPLILVVSLGLMGQFLTWARAWHADWLPLWTTLSETYQFLLIMVCVGALYRYVPYTQVGWSPALVGGVWVAVATELARDGLTFYFGKIPTYSVVYGAFATVPILLIWIYLVWVIVLLGAVLVANLPSLLAGIARDGRVVGWRFQLALEVLHSLFLARQTSAHGLNLMQLCERWRLDPLQLQEVLSTLVELDWIARLGESPGPRGQAIKHARYVLLIDPAKTPLVPLMQRLLLAPSAESEGLWLRWQDLRLSDAL
jgi:membrane protein